MKIASILVATDLTAQGSTAVQRAWQLALAHGGSLKMAYLPGPGRDVPDLAEQALGMDLVVVPQPHGRFLADFHGGDPLARLLRACRCPVLVVGPASDMLVVPHGTDRQSSILPAAVRSA
jgi:nucleotide-binding universal stress UspA family protein